MSASAARNRGWIVSNAMAGAVCVLAGLALPQWPMVGVAVALIVRLGTGSWPGIVLGTTLALQIHATSPGLAAALATGDMVAALLTAFLLTRQAFDPRLERRRDLWLLGVSGLGFAAFLSSAIGAACLAMAGQVPPEELATTWLMRWLQAGMGLVVVGVPLLTLRRAEIQRALGERRWVETVPLAAAALASACAALALRASSMSGLGPLLLVPHALLCWLTARAGLAAGSATVLASAAIGGLATATILGAQAQSTVVLPGGYVATMSAIVLLVHALGVELMRNDRRWQAALQVAGIGVAEWNLNGELGYTSPLWRRMLGDIEGQHTAVLQNWMTRVHPDDREPLGTAIDALVAQPQEDLERQVRLRTGTYWTWYAVRFFATERDSSGVATRLIVTLQDIQAQRGADERQRLSRSLFENVSEGVLIADADLRVVEVNSNYCAMMGLEREALIGTVPVLLQATAPDALTRNQQVDMWASLRVSGHWSGEVRERRRSGEACVLQVTVFTLPNAEGGVRHHVLMVSDVTESRAQRERLERQANFDELTRLPNRTRLTQMLVQAMNETEREGNLLTLCYLDLDNFRRINEQFGRETGDRLLVELASRLRSTLRAHASWADAAGRLGGDEFVLLMRAHSIDESRLAVERVKRVVAMPYNLNVGAGPVSVTASIGATVYPLDRSDADTLIRHADHAMYAAKQTGRNATLMFDLEHSRRAEERVMAIGRVQEALDRQELMLHYQPKVDLRRGVVLGFEALLRWNHPDQGVVAPAHFLPLIEHTGLSARVGDWVLAQALTQLDQWQQAGMDLSVSVNVSARHLQEPDFAQRLAELLARHERPLGPRLELEVLETAALADIGFTSALLERCAVLGVRFALDDFGTGYSTLTYLKRLPVQVLKIDRSFVHNMLEDPQDRAIVEGVVSLSRTFDCVAVAEGVETPAQARVLLELGCDIGQGSGIAPPMPAADVPRFVRDWRGLFPLAAAG